METICKMNRKGILLQTKMKLVAIHILLLLVFSSNAIAQVLPVKKSALFYQNPVIHVDYSDPDVIAVGEDYYLVASSFNAIPGLPILHSRDLVNWSLTGYALPEQAPVALFNKPQHGKGVWAPSIRYHHHEFYIYFPDPDFGIYLTKAKNINGPWSKPVLVQAGKGLIDPCPLWDDNGNVYLVHAFAGSRAGFKSILVVNRLNATGDTVLGDAVLVYDGHDEDATVEGPKFYKRNGYYYIFAPAGGVSTGWQIVLRSKNVFGPYERKLVLKQGTTGVNGPHQGAWIHTVFNEDWFIHFQDKDAYGRILHLQPMQWKNDWPLIGIDQDGDGIGEPVAAYQVPASRGGRSKEFLQTSDEFNGAFIGLQWQWNANRQSSWAFCSPAMGVLRMNSVLQEEAVNNLWEVPNLLLQKFPAEEFSVVTKLSFTAKTVGESTGLLVMGTDYAGLGLVKKEDAVYLFSSVCKNADKGNVAAEKLLQRVSASTIYLAVQVQKAAQCTFSYSTDGLTFTDIPEKFTAVPGKWIGAKFGLYCNRLQVTNDAGYADIDWVRVSQ